MSDESSRFSDFFGGPDGNPYQIDEKQVARWRKGKYPLSDLLMDTVDWQTYGTEAEPARILMMMPSKRERKSL